LKKKVQPVCFVHPGKETSEETKVKRLIKPYSDKLVKVFEGRPYDLNDLRKVLYYLEFPIWNNSAMAYFDTYRKIHDLGYRVVIEGHGADEILGGYPYMIPLAGADFLNTGKYRKSYEIFNVYRKTLNPALDEKVNIKYESYVDYYRKYVSSFLKNRLKNSNTRHIQQQSFEKEVRKVFRKKILQIALRAFDRMTMANSVESRSPYLDYRIVELSRALPLEYKVSKLGSKAILRQILKKYKKDFIYKDKRKTGFVSYTPDFYRNQENRRQITEIIDGFNNPAFKSLKKEAQAKLKEGRFLWIDNLPIWKILALEITRDIYSIKSWEKKL